MGLDLCEEGETVIKTSEPRIVGHFEAIFPLEMLEQSCYT
jgi:hypothetical protein